MDRHRGRPPRDAHPPTGAGCQSECPPRSRWPFHSNCWPSATSINSPCSASPQPCSAAGKLYLRMSLLQHLTKLLTPFSSTIGISLSNGGTAGLFWNYIIASVGLGFVYASIAELGSM
jgi:hypothetical protein